MKILPGTLRKKSYPEVPGELIKKIKGLPGTGSRRAVFDLDNTILNGDIGDALFCRLKNLEMRESVRVDGKKINFSWKEYTGMIAAGEKEAAYRQVTRCMELIPEKLIADLTRELMNNDFRYFEHAGEQIPIPHVDPGMWSLLELLKSNRYDIYVISASNQTSVSVIGEEYLGLDPDGVFGIGSQISEDGEGKKILTGVLREPAPVDTGKAELYRSVTGGDRPMIAAGDSELDFPMLDLVSDGGLVLWRGDDGPVLIRLKKRIGDRAEVIRLQETIFPGKESE